MERAFTVPTLTTHQSWSPFCWMYSLFSTPRVRRQSGLAAASWEVLQLRSGWVMGTIGRSPTSPLMHPGPPDTPSSARSRNACRPGTPSTSSLIIPPRVSRSTAPPRSRTTIDSPVVAAVTNGRRNVTGGDEILGIHPDHPVGGLLDTPHRVSGGAGAEGAEDRPPVGVVGGEHRQGDLDLVDPRSPADATVGEEVAAIGPEELPAVGQPHSSVGAIVER